MTTFDLKGMEDQDFQALQMEVFEEAERRQRVSRGPDSIDQAIQDYQVALGRQDGLEWVQPTGALDAYPKGARVTHAGKTWESTTPANTWEPGASGWREVAEEAAPPPEWVQPTGGHDAYTDGDRVTFQDQVWESTIPDNVWSPADYPQGWTLIEGGDDDTGTEA